jgi:type 1 glutamine amidotransferase
MHASHSYCIRGKSTMRTLVASGLIVAVALLYVASASADERWLTLEGKKGPGQGKHVVLIAGDHEYRSEEALAQLGRILAERHGFKATVLFSQDDDGTVNPDNVRNIPGLELLKEADLMVLGLRFRDLHEEQMQHIADYVASGKPIVALRTSTHAFAIGDKSKKFADWDWTTKGGFGKKYLGETWVAHHGAHGSESTRGLIAPGAEDHPIARGIKDGDIWGPSDVYTVNLPLPGDSKPVFLGQVLKGMKFDDPPVEGKKNDPMMPLVWTKTYAGADGEKGRVVTSTLGAATDFTAPGSRRMFVNAVYWALGMEDEIPEEGTNVELVGEYNPTAFGFGSAKKGLKPADFAK